MTVFVRIFMATTGVVSIVAAGCLLLLRLGALLPSSLDRLFVVAVLITIVCQGVGWVLIAMSERLWNSTS